MMKARLMIALAMIGACSLNVTAMPKSGDTIRTESQISPLEMLLPLEPSYLNGVLVDNPWNANWFVGVNGTAWTTTISPTRSSHQSATEARHHASRQRSRRESEVQGA